MSTETKSSLVSVPYNVIQYLDGVATGGVKALINGGFFSFTRVSTTTAGWIQTMQPHPFSYIETRYQRTLGKKRQHSVVPPGATFSTQWVDTSEYLHAFNPDAIDLLSSVEKLAVISRARTKLRLKVKDQKVNFVQAAAEMDQVVRMLTTNVVRIGKAYSALRRGDFSGAARALGIAIPNSGSSFAKRFRRNQSKAISNGWLELQYGWLPLISDCYGAVELFTQKFSQQNPISVISVTESVERDKSSIAVSGDLTRTTVNTSRYDFKVVCRFKLSQEFPHTAAQIGLTNPALIAWELMPFSFVVDWFIPIGNFISSLDATLGVDFLHGCETTFKKNKAKANDVWLGPRTTGPAGWKHYNQLVGSGESWTESVSCVRVLLSSFPAPIIPMFKDPLTVTHFANALALLKLNLRK